jgi:hypothetical protein
MPDAERRGHVPLRVADRNAVIQRNPQPSMDQVKERQEKDGNQTRSSREGIAGGNTVLFDQEGVRHGFGLRSG